ncbi:MAG: 4Fe-4S dicluster domain-containing protein [Sedimentisphaerales bacterium]|nr:4Fe-4S dicluster domain-containing protein [Sedimentisphaerales bacterium]
MTLQIKKGTSKKGLLAEIEKRTGVNLSACFQCKKCSSGCAVGDLVESPPSEIMRRLHLGAGDELLESDLIWTCASCETCSSRCPMGIDVAAVMDALRVLCLERSKAKVTPKVFNRAFLNSVKRHGRTYEMGMVTAYKFGTGAFMGDVDKFPMMLKKGKLSLLPSSGADKKTVKRIFKNLRQKKEGE